MAAKKLQRLKERTKENLNRKGFIRYLLASGGLLLSYGTLAAMILKFLMPYKKKSVQKIFVTTVDQITAGQTITFSMPNGESYLLSIREVEGQNVYLAYSNRCPHLGCKVSWDNARNEYRCPCHGGVFNTDGVAIEGPPSKAGQRLKKCTIEVADKSIYAVTGA